MKVAIHQPNFLPWPGYFHKYDQCDLMVHMDTAQHVRRDFDQRNWIHTPEGRKRRITVHISGANRSSQPLNRVGLANDNWRRELQNLLYNSYHRAPFYQPHAEALLGIIDHDWPALAELNLALIAYLKDALGIGTSSILLSSLGADLGQRNEQLINICHQVDADTYLSGQGARDFLDEKQFRRAGIKVEFQDYTPAKYPQIHSPFIPNLSVIDLLFNTGPQARKYLLGGSVAAT